MYTAGRYYVGLGRSFLEYPSTWISAQYADSPGSDQPALTVNSPLITIDCSFQYTLNVQKLPDIYRNYEQNYHSNFVKIAKDVINSATDATRFSTEDFYKRRRDIQAAILTALVDELAPLGADVKAFQLRGVELQASTQKTITETVVSAQQEIAKSLDGQIRVINSETAVIQGQADQAIRSFQATQTRDATVIVETAEAAASARLVAAESSVFTTLQSDLSLNTDQLLRYIWYRNLANTRNTTTLALGFSSPLISR